MNITIGQIGAFLTFLTGFIGALIYITNILNKIVERTLKPINDNIKQLDIAQCKNFLTGFLADMERGVKIDKVEIERAYEVYDHYINDLKQNSYMHKRWEEIMENKK